MKINKFLDDKNGIRPELLDTEAMDVAEEFQRAGITTNQLRKFYDEVKKYERDMDLKKKNFSEIEPLIYMLKSKAKYATNNKKRGMYKLYDFMDKCIANIKNAATEKLKKENYKAFCLFFEAAYGFANLKK